VSSCGTAMFNLALSFSKRGLNREALATVEGALKKADGRAPYLTLKAKCLEKLERGDESKETLRQALASYDPPPVLTEWELGWYRMAAKLNHDEELVDKVDEEWNKRRKNKTETPSDDVLHPDIPGTMSLEKEA
jgi:tetratricopeptide (TPR) repeat protein